MRRRVDAGKCFAATAAVAGIGRVPDQAAAHATRGVQGLGLAVFFNEDGKTVNSFIFQPNGK